MPYTVLEKIHLNIEIIKMDGLIEGFDSEGTYFQQKKLSNSIPTIFIHGVGLDNTMWYPQKLFFKKNSTVFYDILNHGKSKKGLKKLNFNFFVKQLYNLIHFLNFNKVNLVGFSIGALIAQHFTEKYYSKINKLVLIGSVYNRSEEQIKTVTNRYKEVLKGKNITKDSIKRWFSDDFIKKNKDVYDFFYDLLEKKNNDDFLPAYKVFIESDKCPLNYINFHMPTLIMTGNNEVGSTPLMSTGIHQNIKNSILYIIQNAKHGATIEKSTEVNKKIFKFLY